MLFKRYLFLAACVLLYIFGYIFYSWDQAHAMESKFREEREQYGVEGVILTTNAPTDTPAPVPVPTIASAPISPAAPTPTPAPATDGSIPPPATTDLTPAPAAPAAADASSAPSMPAGAIPNDASTPAMNPADPNAIIGPVPPPPASPAPDSSTNAPATPSSTMNDRGQAIAPFLVRAGYNPFSAVKVQTPTLEASKPAVPSVTPPPAPVAPTLAAPAVTNAVTTPATNAAPVAAPDVAAISSKPSNAASVIVLLYHQFVPPGAHVDPKFQWTMHEDVFESEMKYLHDNGYHVIPMSDLEKFLRHEIGLPPNSVVITIDDGYKSAIVYAAPILKKYGFPWTYFIYPDFITVAEGKGAASWNDLLALQAEGVDIESHSMTHPILPKHTQKWKGSVHLLAPDEYDEWLINETSGSKAILEQKMGKQIVALAYPYGAYNKEVEAKAIAAGYQFIFTVADNPVHADTDPHSIGRYTMTTPVEKNFVAYLHQGALGLADVDPAPGATTSNPRPVITAVLGYAGNIDPNSIETEVRDYGLVKHDFDPKTSTIRLYLPRDLVQQVNLVNIRVKDAQSGKNLVANWRFNYAPAGGAVPEHAPISTETNAVPAAPIFPPTTETSPAAGATSPQGASNAAPVQSAPMNPATIPPAAAPKTH